MKADDVCTGMFVTVLCWADEPDDTPAHDWNNPFAIMTTPKAKRPKRDLCGEPLQVVAVSLPYIAVRNHAGSVSSLDLRMCEVQPISRAYAKVMLRSRAKRDKDRDIIRNVSISFNPYSGGFWSSADEMEDDES